MTPLRTLLYPELEGFAPHDRAGALERARRQPFDWVELAGLGFGVVAAAAVDPAFAVPLLALAAVPFLWRRTRRALREELGDGARHGARA